MLKLALVELSWDVNEDKFVDVTKDEELVGQMPSRSETEARPLIQGDQLVAVISFIRSNA